jgi:nucleotide-binding universal stress UspA family protein
MSAREVILLPLDGSELAEQALATAVALARRRGFALRLVHVHSPHAVDPIHVEGLPVVDEHLRSQRHLHEQAYLDRVRERLASGVDASTAILHGQPAAALAEDARASGAVWIVMTTHGRGGLERAWLGSVADELVRISPVPLLLVRPRAGAAPSRLQTILVPLDGSPLAEGILEHALRLAGGDAACALVLLAVATNEEGGTGQEEAARYLEGAAGRLTAKGARVRTRVEVAKNAAAAILECVRSEDADLIALATHGRSGLVRVALGSVADTIVRGATVPVLLFRPPQAAS